MEVCAKQFEDLSVQELYELLKLRVDVFVVEQSCPYHELDGKDECALHVFLKDAGEIVAYLRVLPLGAMFDDAVGIGRVIAKRRGVGLGERIIRNGIALAHERMGAGRIRLEAQSYAQGFYEKVGFVRCSDEFDEDGIPHVGMVLEPGAQEDTSHKFNY